MGAYLLQAAGEAAGHALEGPADGDDLVAVVVEHADGEGAQRAAALPAQTVVLLHGVEHVLPQRVAHLVLVVALEAHQRWRGRGDRVSFVLTYFDLFSFALDTHCQRWPGKGKTGTPG